MNNEQFVNVEELFERIEYAVLAKMSGRDTGQLLAAKAALHLYMAQRAHLLKACETVTSVIEGIEGRCMAADGPVTPTHEEVTDSDLQVMYDACRIAVLGSRRRG